jgi:hypothetical protein
MTQIIETELISAESNTVVEYAIEQVIISYYAGYNGVMSVYC